MAVSCTMREARSVLTRLWPIPAPVFPRQFSIVSLFLLLLAPLQFAAFAQSQSTDQVHIVPLENPNRPKIATEPALAAHIKPLRVDVDLVLVPVTVTDPMNRPVLDLQMQ